MTFQKLAAVLAATAALTAGPTLQAQGPALPQLTDRSGAITMQFTIAKWVEIVSDAPSMHNLTGGTAGIAPGLGMVDTPDGMVTREIKANTMYRLSVEGLTESGELEFLPGGDGPGAGILLVLQCKLSATELPASADEYDEWDCPNSGPMVPTTSAWVTLRAFTESPQATADWRAGLYQATVYLQIEAL